jgi:hypothetical protein
MLHSTGAITGLVLWVGLSASATALPAPPQNDPPPRIANEWGGLDHQPTRRSVGAAEQSQGIGLSAARTEEENRQLEAIRHQLLRDARTPSDHNQ